MRDPRWPQLLAQVIEDWRPRAFRWGRADCWQFVGDALFAMTGTEYRAKFPKYRTMRAAMRISSSVGGMQGIGDWAFGPQKPPAFATEGDPVLLDLKRGPTAGICLGPYCASPGPKGLVFVPRTAIIAAWGV